MFTAAKIRDGDGYLDHHLVANDYFNENERVTGEWLGKGAQRLEIEGKPIDAGDKAFAAFRRNRLPSGKKLTPRDSEDRVRFVSFQCSPPKSVSVLAVTAGDARLIEAHRQSVEVALGEMERFAACQCNSMTERQNRFTGNLIAARFTHTSSRELDPQVHDHLVLVAATFDSVANDWRALTEYEIFKAVGYLGRVYENEIARRCRELGYEIRPAYDERHRVIGFEISGVPEETLVLFSKRRAQVERGIAYFTDKHGREPTPAEIQVMVNQTRDSKLKESSSPEVVAGQRAQLDEEELGRLDELKFTAMRRSREEMEPSIPGAERHALREAISHLYERACVAPGHALMAEALTSHAGRMNLDELKCAVTGPELVSVGRGEEDVCKDIFVTPGELRRERWILTVAAEDKGMFAPLAESVTVSDRLSEEQRRAVESLLLCRDRLASLRGAAGVGKTTVLTEVDRNLRAQGRQAVYCAPTATAADTLRKDGLAGAVTLASFLENAARTPLPVGSVLIVDEAGLASHRDGAAVLRLALARDLRVVFVGDTKQHSSVEAGDFLRLIENRCALHRVELLEIRRQTDKDYRHAIRLMSSGAAKDGLSRLDGMGCVHEGGADYLQNASADYVASRRAEPDKTILCVTPTWAENHTLTAAIRRELRQSGGLGEGEQIQVQEPLSWTGREKRDATRYAPGMSVVFDRRSGAFAKGESAVVVSADEKAVVVRTGDGAERKLPLIRGGYDVCAMREIEVSPGDTLLLRANDKARGLINGTLVRVESVRDGQVNTHEGLVINPAEYGRFSHGYVLTSHKSQGKTCDKVIVAAAKLDAKTAYVACSRGRTACTVHAPDKGALLASVSTGNRPLVAEQLGFAAAAKRAEREVTSVEKSMDTVPAYAWFNGPWNKIQTWVKALGNAGLVDAKDRDVSRHENHNAPSL